MNNSKKIAGVATILSVVIILTVVIVTNFQLADASKSSTDVDEKKHVPRYAETCPHERNGRNCEPSKHITDISDLQKRVAIIEK